MSIDLTLLKPLKSLATLQQEYDRAMSDYRSTKEVFDTVSEKLQHARDVVNLVQKALDERMQEIRNNAPKDTDWQRRKPLKDDGSI